MDIEFNIQSILMDFEVGAMKAANKVWKIVTKGCYFHFTQDGWRFVQNSGMASSYLSSKDDEFRLFIRCVLALPHVPIADVEESLEALNNKIWAFNESDEKVEFKEKFVQYVKDTWIEGVYPPQVWNCYARKVDLTNNNLESHNSYLANAVQEAHPSPARLTVALVKELTLAEIKLQKVRRFKNQSSYEIQIFLCDICDETHTSKRSFR